MRKLSRYILKEFAVFLIYCILAFLVIYVLADLVENLDKFIDSDVGLPVIILYYLFYLPYMMILTLPVAMLLATMFSLGRLVGDNEITAMKSSGVSLYRIVMPLYVFSLIVGLIVMGFTEFVVPHANRYMEEIKEKGSEFRFSLSSNAELDRSRVYLANGDGRIIYARGYSSKTRMPQGVVIIEPYESIGDDGAPYAGIKSRIDADYMLYKDDVWMLHNVVERTFHADGETRTEYIALPAPFIKRTPSDFARIDLKPEEMDYFQLKQYIAQVNDKGGDASEWLVDLYLKISFPFVSFVIVFFGAPMAAGSRARGKTASFGIALIISFVFYTFINASQVLGRNGALDPVVAAWLPNGLFFMIGIFMHFHANK
ncbi:hypothetical protein ES708_14592 [subsurface metagenome]